MIAVINLRSSHYFNETNVKYKDIIASVGGDPLLTFPLQSINGPVRQ